MNMLGIDWDHLPEIWETIEGVDCPSISTIAEAPGTTDVDKLMHACETQLKREGIDVGASQADCRMALGLRVLVVSVVAPPNPGLRDAT